MYTSQSPVPFEVRDSCSDLSPAIRIAAINKMVQWSMTHIQSTGIGKRATRGYNFFSTLHTDSYIKSEIRRFMTSIGTHMKTINGGRNCFTWFDLNTRSSSFQRGFGLYGSIPATAHKSMARYATVVNAYFASLELPLSYTIQGVADDKHTVSLTVQRPPNTVGSLANNELFRRMYLVIRHIEPVLKSLQTLSRLMLELPEAPEVSVEETSAVEGSSIAATDERFIAAA